MMKTAKEKKQKEEKIERAYFSLASSVVKLNNLSLIEIIISALNISFNKAESTENIYDTDAAKKILRERVLEHKSINDIISQIASHHPKNHNDKISTDGLVDLDNSLQKDVTLIYSKTCSHYKCLSGSGNATNASYYKFFTFTFEAEEKVKTVFNLIEKNDEGLRQAFISLGAKNEEWNRLVDVTKNYAKTKPHRIDRQQKQFYVPWKNSSNSDKDIDNYILITPLPSTKVISKLALLNANLLNAHMALPAHKRKVGGANPQNAGTLVSDLSGRMHHFRFSFPITNLDRVGIAIKKLKSSQNIIYFTREERNLINEIQKSLFSDSSKSPISRQDLLTEIKTKISSIASSKLDDLEFLRTSYHEALARNLLKHEHLENIEHWLRAYLDSNYAKDQDINDWQTTNEIIRFLYDRLISQFKRTLDASHVRIIEEAIKQTVLRCVGRQ